MKRKPLVTWFPFRFALLIAPLVAAWPPRAQAQTLYWDNNGATAGLGAHTGTWGTSAFWSTVAAGTAATANTATANTHDLIFNGTTGTVTVNAARIAKSLSFGASSVARTVSGGTSITLGGASGNSGIYVLSGNNSNTTVSTPLILATGASTFQNAGTGVLTINGGITGTQNLTLQNNGATANGVTVSTVALNNTGTVTNSGTGGGAALISAGIGANVTTITQSSNASALSVTGAITVGGTNKVFNSTGNAGFTISGGVTGVGNVTLNANGNGAITVSTTSLNNTGTVTNSGTGGGVTTVSAAIGALVTNVAQSGANSQLILSGTNLYTGTTTASAGLVSFTTNLAIPDYATSPATAFGKLSAASGATLALPFGGATNGITNTDVANFLNGTYTTFAVGSSLGIDTTNAPATGANLTTVITNTLAGQLGFTKTGANALTVNAANTYTGPTLIANGTLNVPAINNVGAASGPMGAPITIPNATIGLGFGSTTGTLNYTGAGETTDRVINLAGTSGGGGIINAGAGTLTIGSAVTFTGTGTKTLTVGGTGNTTFGAQLLGGVTGSAAPLTLAKTGTGTLLLGAAGPINTNTVNVLNMAGGIVDIGASGLTISNSGLTVIESTANATINATGGGVLTIGSNTVNNGGDIRPAGGTTLTINANLATPVDNPGFWTAQGGALELNNTGTLVLTGNNTIGGATIFTAAGTLSIGNIATNLGGTNALVFSTAGSRFLYTGTGESTAVPIQTVANTTAIVEQAGPSGTLTFTANWATGAAVKTVTLQGSTAGNGVMSGIISNNSATNTTAITKAGTGAWTLSGANTYTGATIVSGGNLILSQGAGGLGVLDNTLITINSGGTLSPLSGTLTPGAGFSVGNNLVTAAGGRLTLNALGTLNLADGAIGNLNLIQGATFAGNAAVFNGGTINFDISDSAADQIDVRLNNLAGTGLANSTAVGTGISLNPIAGSLGVGNYTLINAGVGSTLNNAHFYLASPNLRVGTTLYNLSLSGTTGTEVLTVGTGGPAGAANLAYWNGTTNASWASQPGGSGTATNWSTSSNGTPDTFALPSSVTNVLFTANSATALANSSTTLDQPFTINSLTYPGLPNAPGSTIASGVGTNALTINAAALSGNAVGNGISVLAGSGAHTISADVTLGANQTWTNSSTNPLSFTGNITGTGRTLTTAGGAGGIQIGNGGTTGSIATDVTLVNNGLLAFNRSNTVTQGTDFPNISGTGSLSQIGSGTLLLSGTNTYTGTTRVTAGKLTVTGSTNQGVAATDVLVADTAVGNAVLNMQGSMTARFLSVGGVTGASGAVNISTGGIFTGGADNELGFTFGAGATTGGYGYLGMTGGTVNIARFQFGGQNVATQNGVGVGVISGGIVNATSHVILSRHGASVGSLTIATGGTLNHTTAQGINMGWQGSGRAELNLTGGTINNAGFNTNFGGGGALWTGTGILNLDAGMITTSAFTSQGTGATSYLNFNGGTLRAVSTQAAFIPALTGVYVNGAFGNFTGGAVIDSNGADITVAANLLAPTGNGVTTIPVSSGGSGYIGAPAVSITDGGSGFGATAIANMVDDLSGNGTLKIDSITITNPGNNYTAPAVSLAGGGNGVTAATFGTPTSAANASGGLTKLGAGTLTLSGTGSTFGGTVTVSGGVLTGSLPASLGGINVATGATLNFYNTATTTTAINALTLASGSALGFDLNAPGVNDMLTLTGTPSISSGVSLNFNNLGGLATGTYDLLSVSAGSLNAANYTLGIAPSGFNYAFSNPTAQSLRLTTSPLNLVYWQGDVSGSWSAAGPNTNWSSDSTGLTDLTTLPASNATLVFSASNAVGPAIATTLDGNVTADSLRFTASPAGVTSVAIAQGSSGILTLSPFSSNNGMVVDTNAGAISITAPVSTGAAQTWEVVGGGANGSSLNVGGNLTISHPITKSGAGALTLSGTNSGAGGLNLAGGTLNINSTSALGTGTFTIGAGTVIDAAGAIVNAGNNTQNWNGNFTFTGTNNLDLGTGAVALGANVQLTTSAASTTTLTVGGIIGDGGTNRTLTKAGTGALVLTGANTYTGVTAITGGIIRITKDTGLGTTAGGTTVAANSALELDGTGGAITVGAEALSINGGGVPAPVANLGALRNIAGDNTYGGTVTLAAQSRINSDSGTLTLNNATAVTGPFTLVVGGAGNVTISGAITTGAGGVNKADGASTLTLSGANTFTGAASVAAGTLKIGSATALSSANALNLSGTGTVDLNGFSISTGAVTSVAGNTITNSSSGTGPSTATALGTPSGAGIYVDALTSTTGAAIAAQITDGATRKTQIVFNNANASPGASLTNGLNTFSGGVVLLNSAAGTRLSPGTVVAGAYGTGPIIIGQAATDKAGIYFANAATLSNPIIFNTGLGTDRLGVRVDAAVTLTGELTANLAPVTFATNGTGTLNATGRITGPSGLVLTPNAFDLAATRSLTVTLSNAAGTNDYAGDTIINLNPLVLKSTTLTLGADNQIPHGAGKGNVIINTNDTGIGTLNLNGFSDTINGLSGNGTVEGATTGTPTNTLTLGDNNATASFNGVIKNTAVGSTLNLVKTGTGTQTLGVGGTYSYTGTTTVSQGTLIVNGNLSGTGAISVAAGATLAGSGTLGGTVTTGGLSTIFSPGNSPGTLTIGGNLDASLGATFNAEVGPPPATDLIAIGGTFTGSTAAGGLLWNLSDAGGLLPATAYTLMTFGSSSGLDSADLAVGTLGAGLVLDTGFGTNGFLINTNSLQVQFSAVPEPTTTVTLLAGLGLLLGRRRRSA